MMLFLEATATLVGTIVGAGIFSLPATIVRVGFWPGMALFAVLTAAVATLHLMYAEIVLRTQAKHRLPGYGKTYLGPRGGLLLLFTDIIGVAVALLVYLVLGGVFLQQLFGGDVLFWTVLFWSLLSLPVLVGLGAVARAELLMNGLLLVAVGAIIVLLFPQVDAEHLKGMHLRNIFVPFGPILFALWGVNAIPQLRDLLEAQLGRLARVVLLGTLIPAAIYVFFVAAVVGSVGQNIPDDALSGMRDAYGLIPYLAGIVFGILAVGTSFIVLGRYFGDVLHYDMRLRPVFAYAIAVSMPMILFLAGLRQFLFLISFLGAVLGGISGVALTAIYIRARTRGDRKPEFSFAAPQFLFLALGGFLALGAVTEIAHVFGVL